LAVKPRHKGGNVQIIKYLSPTLNQDEIVAITGKSGCGKSTLVKLILGIQTPDEGVIRTFGIPHTHTSSTKNHLSV